MVIAKMDSSEQNERKTHKQGMVVVFTCNWKAYSGLEAACRDRLPFPPNVYPLKVMCIGQLSPGILLKTLEKGAEGILLLGCPPGECHFEFGNRRAEDVYFEVKKLAALLGYRKDQIKLDWVPAGGGDIFIDKIYGFIKTLSKEEVP